ncbi:hypothetical protein [Borrelia puertoricensis]|uniref:hypothetical protein n=1 Tax=Borrelia puertoricensis TaxID=2756107 RepID=UPI001FF4E8BE|nr:hypothetical protein [Borrelia puertoricensis]UPA19044.1 hypothetical protein bpuSUM_001585 [Borrelia puertoricensis]
MTYSRRYAFVGSLSIESEFDTDASSLEHIQEANDELASIVKCSIYKFSKGKSFTVETVTKSTIEQQSSSHTSITKFESLSKRIPAKYYYYKKFIQASKKMHAVLYETLFDSLEMIDKFLI